MFEVDKPSILSFIDTEDFETVLQPIYSVSQQKVYGFEALTRCRTNPSIDIGSLFSIAKEENLISKLDMACRSSAIRKTRREGLHEDGALIFLNICPEALMDPAHRSGITDELAANYGIPREKIVLEITEESAIHNYDLFNQAVFYYRQQGYRIAIDDFGAGYGGLKMLSIIEPDFVKIDRHFISEVDRAMIKFNLVDSVSHVCSRLGIKVIAEGIERKEELDTVIECGIDLVQGYYLARPSPSPVKDVPAHLSRSADIGPVMADCCEYITIESLTVPTLTISPSTNIGEIYRLFIDNAQLRTIPVVTDGILRGVLHRGRYFENAVLGRFGFGLQLNASKTAYDLMEPVSCLIEITNPIEDVARRIKLKRSDPVCDDICVTKRGRYMGTVSVSSLLDALTERSLVLARDTNPLSGLPGNAAIRTEIERRLAKGCQFAICYIDINNFKPFNDHYGFERGDDAITTLSEVIVSSVKVQASEAFIGHIGGDDFILICRPHESLALAEYVIGRFEQNHSLLHGEEDRASGSYQAINRSGIAERFGLLSLSIGIVSTDAVRITSYAQVASLATEVKKGAKMRSMSLGCSAVLKDERLQSLKLF